MPRKPSMSDPEAGQLLAGLRDTPAVVAVYDERDLLRWANAAYEARFLRGRPLPIAFADVLRHGHREGFGIKIENPDIEAFLSGVLSRRRSEVFRSFAVDLVDGEWLWMTETRLHSGWLLSIASVITSLKAHERVLADAMNSALSAAFSDPLTGCANRRALAQRAVAMFAQAQRDAAPVCLVAIDLDHFKLVNDRFGHAIGDEVLRHFARHCQGRLRQSDYFGRLGGEEFVAILAGTPMRDAFDVAERLRTSLSALDLGAAPAVPYTFSAGVVQVQPGETWETALIRADKTLYQAKALGRNRVDCAP